MKVLDGKIAIVTGGSGQLGGAICESLAREGAVINNFDISKGDEFVRDMKSMNFVANSYSIDITNSEAVNEAVQKVIEKYGTVDILVNSAGIVSIHEKSLLTVTDEIWNREIAVLLSAAFYCSRAVLSKMIEQRSGKIINISSMTGEHGRYATSPAYAAAKAAIYGLTMSMGKNVAQYGIQVNAVSPGFILTKLHSSFSPEMIEKLSEGIPYIRKGIPEDVANAVLYLCGPDSEYLNGTRIRVNGGTIMS